ncbi:hypothetical protein QBC47DRAFT_379315 [Echria macrotheca]|uniref:Uncharacterized protein n=1 Tax=Echria macrotheca TaxID=438768 RepID=A0AAJ0FAB3_9PEZI|nr:hypothetical protein QBC47DRAFT_379315 [Echria macrotheca]
MASFSRGLGGSFGHQFLVVVRQQPIPCRCTPTPIPPTTRSLVFRLSRSPSRFLQTAARPSKPKTIPKKPSASPSTPVKNNATTPRKPFPVAPSYAAQLAAKGRVTLYESPSHFWFRFSSIAASTFCISYTVYHYWSIYLHPLPNQVWWAPHAFGVICLFMTGMGGYFLMGTARIIRSLDAVSVSKMPASLAKTAATRNSPIYLEIQTQRIVPFMPRKRVSIWPDQLRLPFRMADAVAARETGLAGAKPLSPREQLAAMKAAEEARKREREYNLQHIWTAPFRDGKKAFGIMWRGTARAFSREGFAKVEVDGVNYKLDTTGGWALDHGRALDRVVGAKAGAAR